MSKPAQAPSWKPAGAGARVAPFLVFPGICMAATPAPANAVSPPRSGSQPNSSRQKIGGVVLIYPERLPHLRNVEIQASRVVVNTSTRPNSASVQIRAPSPCHGFCSMFFLSSAARAPLTSFTGLQTPLSAWAIIVCTFPGEEQGDNPPHL